MGTSSFPTKLLYYHLGQVVQSWVSSNPGLKFNPLFSFLYFYPCVSSKTLGTKSSIDIEKISEGILRLN